MGDIGATINLKDIGKGLRSDFKLFSESNTCWIIEIKKEKQNVFEKLLKSNNVSFVCIGYTGGKNLLINDEKATLVDLDIVSIRKLWKKAIWDVMG